MKSDFTADPALSSSLSWRHPEISSSLNYPVTMWMVVTCTTGLSLLLWAGLGASLLSYSSADLRKYRCCISHQDGFFDQYDVYYIVLYYIYIYTGLIWILITGTVLYMLKMCMFLEDFFQKLAVGFVWMVSNSFIIHYFKKLLLCAVLWPLFYRNFSLHINTLFFVPSQRRVL